MKKLLLILSATYFMAGCHDKKDCSPATTSLRLLPDKQITTQQIADYDSQVYTVDTGANLLAQYSYARAQCENTYDDEYSELLTFEVNTALEAFTYVDEDIQQTKCFYQEKGAWVSGQAYAIRKGTITGKKLSENQWYIEVKVTINPLKPDMQPKAISIEGVFNK